MKLSRMREYVDRNLARLERKLIATTFFPSLDAARDLSTYSDFFKRVSHTRFMLAIASRDAAADIFKQGRDGSKIAFRKSRNIDIAIHSAPGFTAS